jgi:hypothetical protein
MNMSYVRFENTAGDLQDCVHAQADAVDIPGLDLSQYEAAAYQRMVSLCQEFLDQHDRLAAATTQDQL